jgi:hypothetical protein
MFERKEYNACVGLWTLGVDETFWSVVSTGFLVPVSSPFLCS